MMAEWLADLHLHSKYSRATSKYLDLDSLYLGAKIKGIDVLGTADFTHPLWFEELTQKLDIDKNGLYHLKPQPEKELDLQVPQSCRSRKVWFVPTVEISCIYHRHKRLRKVHLVIVMPSLEQASQLNRKLSQIGNLLADGRPTLSLDSKDLLEMTLEISQDSLFIPAHIWTPWFGLFGSQSGFDSLEEAFGDLTKYIYAVETGLSSDPPMNRLVNNLDKVLLVSNSDAHSSAKLGREATILKGNISYQNLVKAIKHENQNYCGTIEFFPEEGKYHYDGHRKCHLSFHPDRTHELEGICPVCGRPLTIGVLNRVHDLAQKRKTSITDETRVEYIIPLAEILAQLEEVKSTTSKRVQKEYQRVIANLGSEFDILRKIPIEKINLKGDQKLSQAIDLMRLKKVQIHPGFDGEYGQVRIALESQNSSDQLSLL